MGNGHLVLEELECEVKKIKCRNSENGYTVLKCKKKDASYYDPDMEITVTGFFWEFKAVCLVYLSVCF